jgi:hypothetical protein
MVRAGRDRESRRCSTTFRLKSDAVTTPVTVRRLRRNAGVTAQPALHAARTLLSAFPLVPTLAPPVPQRIAPFCSPASSQPRRGPTSQPASSATAPHLPDAGPQWLCMRHVLCCPNSPWSPPLLSTCSRLALFQRTSRAVNSAPRPARSASSPRPYRCGPRPR